MLLPPAYWITSWQTHLQPPIVTLLLVLVPSCPCHGPLPDCVVAPLTVSPRSTGRRGLGSKRQKSTRLVSGSKFCHDQQGHRRPPRGFRAAHAVPFLRARVEHLAKRMGPAALAFDGAEHRNARLIRVTAWRKLRFWSASCAPRATLYHRGVGEAGALACRPDTPLPVGREHMCQGGERRSLRNPSLAKREPLSLEQERLR